MKNKIEFIEGEEFCRYNGILMTPENHRDLFGFYGEMEEYEYNDKKYIYLSLYDEENFKQGFDIDSSKIYIEAKDIKEAIFLFLHSVSCEETNYSYDDELDEAHGFAKEHTRLIVDFEQIERIQDIEILTEEIKSKLKIEEYFDFINALDLYYNKLS